MAQPPGLTKDGYESQFGTNHVGHALFTKLLLPTLQKTAAEPNSDVRIINLSSEGHKFAPKGGFLPDKSTTDMADYSTWTRYGQSKLANILFTRSLAEKYPEITSVAIHPGAVNTNLAGPFIQNHPYLGMMFGWLVPMLMANSVVGAYNQTWAATAPVVGKAWTAKETGGKTTRMVKNGWYYVPVAKEDGDSKISMDKALAEKLWQWTEKELAAKGY
jgi:NAD(P)-dependent dehydrogenase (short-subunit alcohol dehydrogenase family)